MGTSFASSVVKGAAPNLYEKWRAMRSRTSLVSTTSLEPEAIPLSVKVVLLGDRWLYYTLQTADPEFDEIFRTGVDLEDDIEAHS